MRKHGEWNRWGIRRRPGREGERERSGGGKGGQEKRAVGGRKGAERGEKRWAPQKRERLAVRGRMTTEVLWVPPQHLS